MGRGRNGHIVRVGGSRGKIRDARARQIGFGGGGVAHRMVLRTVRFAYVAGIAARPVRFRRRHRFLGKRSWDAPIHRTSDEKGEL